MVNKLDGKRLQLSVGIVAVETVKDNLDASWKLLCCLPRLEEEWEDLETNSCTNGKTAVVLLDGWLKVLRQGGGSYKVELKFGNTYRVANRRNKIIKSVSSQYGSSGRCLYPVSLAVNDWGYFYSH